MIATAGFWVGGRCGTGERVKARYLLLLRGDSVPSSSTSFYLCTLATRVCFQSQRFHSFPLPFACCVTRPKSMTNSPAPLVTWSLVAALSIGEPNATAPGQAATNLHGASWRCLTGSILDAQLSRRQVALSRPQGLCIEVVSGKVREPCKINHGSSGEPRMTGCTISRACLGRTSVWNANKPVRLIEVDDSQAWLSPAQKHDWWAC